MLRDLDMKDLKNQLLQLLGLRKFEIHLQKKEGT